MLNALQRISNSAVRIAMAATVGCSIATIASAIAIGTWSSRDEAAHRLGLYAALAGTGVGAVVGVFTPGREARSAQRSNSHLANSHLANSHLANSHLASIPAATTEWQDWRNFIVVRKVQESREITSFYLNPQDGGRLPRYRPGQFLTIRLDIPEHDRPIIRTYSLSDEAAAGDYYRLSIKREPAPPGLDVPPGIASNYMHDRIQVGSVIPAKPPSGQFVLDTQKTTPVVLISNGVGITPMIAMAKAAGRLNPTRPVWFLHGARDGSYHAFREEVLAIAQQNPAMQIHYRYSRPRLEDNGNYHSQGYIDAELIQTLVRPDLQQHQTFMDAEYFLCGSPSFMQSLREGLGAMGVPERQIFFESFTKATKAPKAVAVPTGSQSVSVEDADVVFASSQQTATWHSGDGTLLEFAEANGLEPAYSCRQGICLTCMCKLRQGDVEYVEPPTGTPDNGSVLICISQPKSARVVLEL